MPNHAFIDGTNLHQEMRRIGWQLDYRRLRRYLREKYDVADAWYFIGHLPEQQQLYASLTAAGYSLVFKPTTRDSAGRVKGNCDADLVLHAALTINDYGAAVLISGDGDFCSLVHELLKRGKLARIIAPSRRNTSVLLRRATQHRLITYVEDLRNRLERKSPQIAPGAPGWGST